MNDKIFFDTNVILNSYSSLNDQKSIVARKPISNPDTTVRTQVLQEMCNVLIKKFKLDQISILGAISEISNNFKVSIKNIETISNALQIHFKYQYSYYDSLIIASAIENECCVLYSEDLQHNQKIENSLMIINPFK